MKYAVGISNLLHVNYNLFCFVALRFDYAVGRYKLDHGLSLWPEMGIEYRPHALVGVIVLDSPKYKTRTDRFRPCLANFAEWCTTVRSPIVRVIVGDSGNGIPKVLGKCFSAVNEDEIPCFPPEDPLRKVEKVLFWSFNKWSTSDPSSALVKSYFSTLYYLQNKFKSVVQHLPRWMTQE